MSKFVKSSVLVITVIMMAVIGAGCSPGFVPQQKEDAPSPSPPSGSPSNVPTNGLVQSNTDSAVTIDMEWIKAKDGSLIFSVAMNTHSVDLDQYDLGELTILRDDADNEYHPVSWDSAPGGHHRMGTLTFPLPDSVSQGNAKYIEVMIRDIAGIEERVFKWEL